MKSYRGLKGDAKPRANCFISLILICSILSFALLSFTIALFPAVFQMIVNTQVVLSNGTLSYTQWVQPTPAIYKIITVYNITNPANVSTGGTPELEAMGPYYYREYREKINITLDENDTDLTFGERKFYHFDFNMSNPHFNASNPNDTGIDPSVDKFTTINIAYVGIADNLTRDNAGLLKIMAVTSLARGCGEESLFMSNHTVNEVVFGYKDKLLTELSTIMPGLPTTVQIMYNMSEHDMDKPSTVNNGVDNKTMLGQYSQWQGYKTLPWWNSTQANTVNGTEGLFFNPELGKEEILSIWTDDLFRSIVMEFESEEARKGLHTYKFRTPFYSMRNATNNPNNAGFYSFCPDGMNNLTSAVNAPVFVSKPSFLEGDPSLANDSIGLPAANASTMDTKIWIEPSTGVLVDAIKQLQANVMITKTAHFPKLTTLREKARFVPLALIQET